jgi:hypothetical protein
VKITWGGVPVGVRAGDTLEIDHDATEWPWDLIQTYLAMGELQDEERAALIREQNRVRWPRGFGG